MYVPAPVPTSKSPLAVNAAATAAAADAALSWGLVPKNVEEVVVHMDGGVARVRISDDRRATLIGPAAYIGTVTVPV